MIAITFALPAESSGLVACVVLGWVGAHRPDDEFHGISSLRSRPYYNASLTRWLNMSLDLQVIDPALKKALGL